MNDKKPLLMAHAGGMAHGRENSVKAVQGALKYKPDIIELDVRKSWDGILFCYHGFPWWRFLLAYFLRLLPFSMIKNIIKVNILDELMRVIDNERVIVFMDIKDKRIAPEDINSLCNDFKNEIWIAAVSLNYLVKMKQMLGHKCKYVYNFSFLNLKRGLKNAEKAEIDMFKLFPWQCNKDSIEAINKGKLKFAIHELGSAEKYNKLVQKYGSVWVAVDEFNANLITG